MTKRIPGGTPNGGEFAPNEHDEASSSLTQPSEHETFSALNSAARNGDADAVSRRRKLIDDRRDARGYDSINFETVHVPRAVTVDQALSELTSDLSEACQNGALDPDYEYTAERFGSRVHVRMRSRVGRKPARSHFANSTWMRLEARVGSYQKNGVDVTLAAEKPWLVV